MPTMYKMVNGVKVEMDAEEAAALQAKWDADAEYKQTASSPTAQPINKIQFHAMLGRLGLTSAVEAAIEAMDEPAKSIARAKIYYSDTYRRDHSLFTQLKDSVGITDAEIDAAWEQALEIE